MRKPEPTERAVRARGVVRGRENGDLAGKLGFLVEELGFWGAMEQRIWGRNGAAEREVEERRRERRGVRERLSGARVPAAATIDAILF